MTQIQAGEGARFPHRRSPKGSLRERRSGMENGVCQEKPNKVIYSTPCDDSSRESQETPWCLFVDKEAILSLYGHYSHGEAITVQSPG
jgi:hypothetical protein